MDVDQVGSPQRSDLSVNDIVSRIIKWVPRRRWCCLNSQHFGPLFSVPALIEVPLTDIERLLNAPEVSWLNWLNNSRNTGPFWRPNVKKTMQDSAIRESTPNGWPVWIWIDKHGPPPYDPDEQLAPVREGWDSLDGATQASLTEKAENGAFGIEPPRRGWNGLECPPPVALPPRRSRPSRDGESTKPKRVRSYQGPTRDGPEQRRASAPAALQQPPDDDVVVAPAPAPSLAEGLKILGRAVAEIKGAGGPALRAALIGEFVAGFTEGQHCDLKKELRDVVDVATSTEPVDFHRDVDMLKFLGQRVHFELEKRNGCTGIGAFVMPSGCLVPWDPAIDVTSKTAVAPRLMATLAKLIRVQRWCQDQERAEESQTDGHEYYDKRTKKWWAPDSPELAAFVTSRADVRDLQLAILSDVIVLMNCNGGTPVLPRGLTYLSLSNKFSGLSKRSQTHMSVMGLGVSHGSLRTLEKRIVANYGSAWPSLMADLIKRSPHHTRDGSREHRVDACYASFTDEFIATAPAYRRGEVYLWLQDNYCKILAARRHLRLGKNSGVIVTQTRAICWAAENCLRHPDTPGLPAANVPFDGARVSLLFKEHDVGYTGLAASPFPDVKCFCREDDFGLFSRARCPREPNERFYVHDFKAGPQMGGSSTSRDDFAVTFLEKHREYLNRGAYCLFAGDTEYSINMAAVTMASLPRLTIAGDAPSRAASKQPKELVVVEVCPELDEDLEGMVIEIDMKGSVEQLGVLRARTISYRGRVRSVFKAGEDDAVEENILAQMRAYEDFIDQDSDADDDDKPAAAASPEEAKKSRLADEKRGGKKARWVFVEWKKEDEPGFCMNMLAPKRYSPKKQPMKGGLCHWRVFRAKEEAEG